MRPVEVLVVGAEHHDGVAGEEELADGTRAGQVDVGHLDRLAAGDVVDLEVAVADPDQQLAVGLHHVRLVDPGLLDVGAGRAVALLDHSAPGDAVTGGGVLAAEAANGMASSTA